MSTLRRDSITRWQANPLRSINLQVNHERPPPDVRRDGSTFGSSQHDQEIRFGAEVERGRPIDCRLQILVLIRARWSNQSQTAQARIQMLEAGPKLSGIGPQN